MHAKRKTLFPKDMHLVRTIISIWDPTSWLAKHQSPTMEVNWTEVKKVMPPKRDVPSGIISRMKKAASKKVIGRKGKGKSVSTKRK